MRPVFYERGLHPNLGISWKTFTRLFLIIAAVLFSSFLWTSAHRVMSLYRASQYQKAAQKMIAENKADEALLNVRHALFEVPGHIGACRLMARLLDEQGDPRALDYYRFVALEGSILPSDIQLGDTPNIGGGFFEGEGDVLRSGDKFFGPEKEIVLSPNATQEDAENLALAAVKYGSMSVAWDVANLVSSKWKDLAFPHIIKASINGRLGYFDLQEAELRSAIAKSENLETAMALYQFILSRPEPNAERSAELASLLQKITDFDPSSQSLLLITQTLTSGIFQPQDSLSVLEILRGHPAGDTSYLLFADKFQLGLQPKSRSLILQNVVKRSQSLPTSERLPAVDWLLDLQEPSLAQSVLPLSDAFESRRAFEMWVETALDLKQWGSIEKALADSANPLSSHQSQALLATIAALRGEPTKSRKIWGDVIASNRANPQIVLELLISLARAAEWTTFYRELPILIDNPSWALKSVEILIPVVRQHRDSTIMLEFYQRTMQSPLLANQDTVMDRLAYTRLILGEAVSMEQLELRAKKNPDNAAFRVTYALGLLKSRAKVKALFTLKDFDPPLSVNSLLPYQKAIFALIVAANGNADEARVIAHMIALGSLTRQEEAMLDTITAQKSN
jgi:hypothetical protein